MLDIFFEIFTIEDIPMFITLFFGTLIAIAIVSMIFDFINDMFSSIYYYFDDRRDSKKYLLYLREKRFSLDKDSEKYLEISKDITRIEQQLKYKKNDCLKESEKFEKKFKKRMLREVKETMNSDLQEEEKFEKINNLNASYLKTTKRIKKDIADLK